MAKLAFLKLMTKNPINILLSFLSRLVFKLTDKFVLKKLAEHITKEKVASKTLEIFAKSFLKKYLISKGFTILAKGGILGFIGQKILGKVFNEFVRPAVLEAGRKVELKIDKERGKKSEKAWSSFGS